MARLVFRTRVGVGDCATECQNGNIGELNFDYMFNIVEFYFKQAHNHSRGQNEECKWLET